MDNYSELLNITGVRCLCWKHQNGLAVKHKRIEKQISMILSFLQAFLHLFSLSQVFRVINGLINLILDLNYPCLAGRQLSQPNAYACIPHTLPSSEISNLFNTLKVGTSQLNLNYSLKLNKGTNHNKLTKCPHKLYVSWNHIVSRLHFPLFPKICLTLTNVDFHDLKAEAVKLNYSKLLSLLWLMTKLTANSLPVFHLWKICQAWLIATTLNEPK